MERELTYFSFFYPSFFRIQDIPAQPVIQTPVSCQYPLSISLISSNFEMFSSCSPVFVAIFVKSQAGYVTLFCAIYLSVMFYYSLKQYMGEIIREVHLAYCFCAE